MAASDSHGAAASNGDTAVAALFQGVHKGSTAYRLLSRMGWKEGQGLGAQKQGITTHVKVKKKHDATGVGMAENVDRQRDWTTGMVNFDLILSKLKEVAAKHEHPSEDNGTHGKPPVRSKKKGQALKKGKGKVPKPAVPSESSDSSGSSSSSEGDEDNGVQKPGTTSAKLATHVGRYHRRERAKSVRGYSAGDLAAILGAVDPATTSTQAQPMNPADAAWAPVGAREVRSSHQEQEDSADDEAAHVRSDECTEAEAPPAGGSGSPGPRSWWTGLFVKAGRMGSTKHELHSTKVKGAAAAAGAKPVQPCATSQGTAGIKINGFSEQDQEHLYEKVHLGATHGKQGLGRGSAPKKVAGAHWSGTKTKLDSDSEDEVEEGAEEGGAGSSSSDEPDDAVVVLASKKEQAGGHAGKEVVKLLPCQAAEPTRPAKGAKQAVAEAASKKNGKEQISGKKRASGGAPVQSKGKASEQDNGASCKDISAVSQQPGEAAEAKEPVAGAQDGRKVKWKQLARGVLKAAPNGRLKVQQLSKRVHEAAGLGSAGDKEPLMKKLKSLPLMFEVGDKFVRLL